MDLILVLAISVVVAVTGIISPKPKSIDPADEVEVIQTQEKQPAEVVEIQPEIQPVKAPEPIEEPEPVKEPEKVKEEPKPKIAQIGAKPENVLEKIKQDPIQEEEAKPEEPELKLAQEAIDQNNNEEGSSWLNIILYILGAISVIAAGIYFFMRRETTPQSAADLARRESNLETTFDKQPTEQEAPSENKEEQPTEQEAPSENIEPNSSNDDENNNR